MAAWEKWRFRGGGEKGKKWGKIASFWVLSSKISPRTTQLYTPGKNAANIYIYMNNSVEVLESAMRLNFILCGTNLTKNNRIRCL